MSADNPISPKAIASTTGSGLGAVAAGMITWILGISCWHESASASNVSHAVAAVPSPISAAIGLLIPAGLAWGLGWWVTDPNRVSTKDLHLLQDLMKGKP